ncbi:MAG: winged helix-turn-helix transcriptional regulator [Thermoplasmatota archaeon]
MMVVDGKRVARAFVLGTFLVLLLGSGTGLALAQDAKPGKTAMARPAPGDHAVFTADEFHIGEAQGELKGMSLELTWMPERWVPDQDLNLRLVHPLVTRVILGDIDLERQADYDAATGEPILSSGRGEYYGGTSSSSGALGLYNVDEAQQRYWYDSFEGRGGPCGARNALQDGQDVDQPLTVTGYCDYIDGDEVLTYEYAGSAKSGGYDAHHFQEPERPYFQLWASAEVPFPVRFTASLSNLMYAPFLGHERMYDLRLESFTPGEGSYSWPPTSIVLPGAGLPSLVPRVPLVVDTTAYPFPLDFQQAYDAAVADGSVGLSSWLANHPGAYVAEAYSNEWTDDNGATHYAWYFIVTDGHSWTGRSVREGPLEAPLLGTWLPEAAGRGLSVKTWAPDDDERNWAGHYLPPERLPATLPSATDLLARHRFVENRDIPDAHYLGWTLTCETPACLQPHLWMAAGYARSESTSSEVPLLLPSGGTTALSLLAVDVGGNPVSRNAYSFDRPAFSVTGQGDDKDGAGFVLGAQAIEAQPAWLLPSPAAATGLGLLGVLASVLYYFWPHAKSLALAPFFTRIADDELLHNPNRSRILDLVRAEPGIHFQDLARKAGVGRGTLDHHLRKLVDAELVSIRRTSGYACCFPKGVGAIDRRLMDAAPVLRSEGGRAVLQVVARRPGASSRDLAIELGLAPSTVSYHLKRLETAGLVLPDPSVGVRLTPLGEQAKA